MSSSAAPLVPPLAPSLVVGRAAELARLSSGLGRVPCAVILGLAGVGKSAVARRFAAEWPHPVWVQHARQGTSLDELLDDAERQLGSRGPGGGAIAEGERAAALAQRLDEHATLWLIEDGDRVAGMDRLLGELAARLRRGRVIVTARERLFTAMAPERVELVLDGLAEEDARSLWQHLDELYGASPGFAAAWQASRGNPFQLRQAHAGVIDAIDPAAAAVAALPARPRRLALALALSAAPLPRAVLLDGLLDGLLDAAAEVSASLRYLVARLVVEPAGAGRFAVHDLLRGALLRAASEDELAEVHAQLAAALERLPVAPIGAPGRTARAGDGMDPVVCIRERVRHLLGAGQRAAARQLLLDSASALIRGGAAAELLRGLEALEARGASPDPEVQLARARTWIRMLELHRAYDQMCAVVEREAAVPPAVALEAQVSLAHLSMLTCRLEEAVARGRAAQRARSLPMPLRVRLVTVEVLTRTAMGEGDAARGGVESLVPAEVARQAPAILRAYLLFTRAFSFWLEERDAEAEAEMRTSWALCKDVLSFRARVLAPLFFASVLARTGRRAESARVLAEVERDVAEFDDPLVQVSQRAIRVILLECEGAFEEALALAVEVEATYQQAGMTFGALWARLHRGRISLLAGRVRAGRALLDELVRRAGELGARMLVRLAKDALRLDPLAALAHALAHGTSPSARPGEVHRARVLAAVAAAIEGRRDIARGYVVALRAEAAEAREAKGATGDALSAALLQLVEATIVAGRDAMAEGAGPLPGAAAVATSEALVAAALAGAAAAGVDPELLPAVMARLPLGGGGPAMPGVGEGPGSGEAASGPSGGGVVVVVLDRERHELRSGERVVSLARRPSVRGLLYTLAADLGRICDKESLARGLWSTRYHPARHDGALWVSIKRLREVLAGTGLSVESSDEGYRLRIDDGYRLRAG